MKIEGPHATLPIEATRTHGLRRPEPRAPEPRNDDSVTISDEARTLFDARGPERPDTAKVAALRERIANGTFTVDADRIASVMLEEELG